MKTILFIMPFGTKNNIDFDVIYKKTKQEIEKTNGFIVYRVDKMSNSTNIDEKMYKGIIAADIVVADLSLHNPNVMYELGIRHSFVAKTTKLIKNEMYKETIPFDINHIGVHSYNENYAELAAIILNEEKGETDSAILSNVSIPQQDFSNFYSVFSEWEATYNSFINEYNELENEKKYDKMEDFFDRYSKVFNSNFEPYATRKALYTYKHSGGSIESLMLAKETISKLNVSRNSSSEVIGLLCSINNRLLMKDLCTPKEVYDLTSIFLADKMTTYSVGVYVMSRVILSGKGYLTKQEALNNIRRVVSEFPLVKHSGRDIPYIEDTINLAKFALGEVGEDVFNHGTSKENVEIIAKWLGTDD